MIDVMVQKISGCHNVMKERLSQGGRVFVSENVGETAMYFLASLVPWGLLMIDVIEITQEKLHTHYTKHFTM